MKKEIKINRNIIIALILISVIVIGISSSYALFQINVRKDKIVEIQTTTEPINTLVKTIKEKAYQDKEIIAINNDGDKCETLASCAGNIREYRYSGSNVNNYIYLQDSNNRNELWRIIGIFTDQYTKKEYIKVIRDQVLPAEYIPNTYKISGETYKIKSSGTSAYWNRFEPSTGSERNNWATAGLQYFLNTEQDSNGTKGYLSYLSSETKKLLRNDVKYYFGTIDHYTDNAKTAYIHERDVENCIDGKGSVGSSSNFPNAGCNVWSGNDATWTGAVGLMYPSDYGYSATSDNWDKVFYNASSGSFRQEKINSTSWLYATLTDTKSKNSWTITPSYSASGSEINWGQYGNLGDYGVNATNSVVSGVRPVLNLKSQVFQINGKGTKESPYVWVKK